MNPKEFSWTEEQQVTVSNPTPEPYKFKVHNKEYQLGAGRTAKMPGYIAWVYVYNMASQLAQADGTFNHWNEEGHRQQYFDKIVAGVDPVVQAVEIEPEVAIEVLDDDEEEGATVAPDTEEAEEADDLAGEEEDATPEDDSPVEEPAPAGVQPMTRKPKAKASSRGRSSGV